MDNTGLTTNLDRWSNSQAITMIDCNGVAMGSNSTLLHVSLIKCRGSIVRFSHVLPSSLTRSHNKNKQLISSQSFPNLNNFNKTTLHSRVPLHIPPTKPLVETPFLFSQKTRGNGDFYPGEGKDYTTLFSLECAIIDPKKSWLWGKGGARETEEDA